MKNKSEPTLTVISGPENIVAMYCRTSVKNNPYSVRMSKGDFRKMIYGDLPWLNERENLTIEIYNNVIRQLMIKGRDIVIDDLNQNQKNIEFYEELCKKHSYDFKHLQLTTESTIRGNSMDDNFVLFQLEGGLIIAESDDIDRWRVDETILEILENDALLGMEIALISCLIDREEEMIKFLRASGITYDKLIIKPESKRFTLNEVFKKSLLNTILPHKFFMTVYEADSDAIEMWREQGVHCLDVTRALAM